jgi:hypothetical protein
MPRHSTGVDSALINYIQAKQADQSRYEIDLSLIQAGHSPVEIEAAWKEALPPRPQPLTLKGYLRSLEFYALLAGLVAAVTGWLCCLNAPTSDSGLIKEGATGLYWLYFLPGLGVTVLPAGCLVGCLLALVWYNRGNWTGRGRKKGMVEGAALMLGLAMLLFLLAAVSASYRHIQSVPYQGRVYRLAAQPPTIWTEATSQTNLVLFECDSAGLFCHKVASYHYRGRVDTIYMIAEPSTHTINIGLTSQIIYTYPAE